MYSGCMQALGRVVLPTRTPVGVPAMQHCIHARRTTAAAAAPPSASYAQGGYPPPAPQYSNNQHVEFIDAQYSDASLYQPVAVAPNDARRYISWAVYKKSAALTLRLVRARYQQKGDNSWTIDREGNLLLEFAQALQSTGPEEQNRRYDWANKQLFALSAVELSTIMDDTERQHSFFHDPNMKRPDQGTITKRFNWTPSANQPGTYLLSLNVSDKANQQKSNNYNVSLTRGEVAVLKNLTPNLVWHMLGFSEVLVG